MAGAKDTIAQLREALTHSPDNIPLRRMLAAALASAEEFDAADAVTTAAMVGHSSVTTTQLYDRRGDRAMVSAAEARTVPFGEWR